MRGKTYSIYFSIWIVYALCAFRFFPLTNSNILFPIIPLAFAGGWIWGRTGGLLTALCILFFYIALNEYYADIYNYYSDRLMAPMIVIAIVIYSGTLKENQDKLTRLRRRLDSAVEERNNDLQALTNFLLEKTEKQKIAHGQGLHDGMGQHITGIQLLCSSLSEQLKQENHLAAPLAEELKQQTHSVHNRIRKISRMHFPVRIGEVGFMPALNELSSSVQDIKPIQFKVDEQKKLHRLPETTSLQLYRICQEASLHAIDQLGADTISITVKTTDSALSVGIMHNGDNQVKTTTTAGRLIRYRLNILSGSIKQGKTSDGLESTTILIPRTTENS